MAGLADGKEEHGPCKLQALELHTLLNNVKQARMEDGGHCFGKTIKNRGTEPQSTKYT